MAVYCQSRLDRIQYDDMQIVVSDSINEGLEKAKEELYKRLDNKTVLFLSGGTTPRPLYERIAKEKIIKPAAVAMIDERYGDPMHENSNEKMISETGLLGYFDDYGIPFYPIITGTFPREELAEMYDENVRKLFFHFHKNIAIMGIGADGHTAGIAPNRKNFTNPVFENEQKHLFVSDFVDSDGPFGERVTLTFAGLSLIDFFIVLAFGEDKKEALQKTFIQGALEEVPARFYNTSEIAKKTLFITDQKI